MRRFVGLFVITLLCTGCPGRAPEATDKPRVVCSIFVIYDMARAIGGEKIAVSLFSPPGAEPHTYEPSAREMLALKTARVFLYTGGLMEPWAARVLQAVGGPGLTVANVTEGIDLLTADEEDAPGEHGDDDHGPVDPHFWLDPARMITAAGNVERALALAAPDQAPLFAARAERLKKDLTALDREIRESLAGRAQSTLVYGGHNVFGYFGKRYGLRFVSPYAGFSPEAEPQARKLVELKSLMRRQNLSVIYYGEGVDPQLARVLADSAGARLALLNGVHNVSAEELKAGATYLSIMRANLAVLKADPGLFGN